MYSPLHRIASDSGMEGVREGRRGERSTQGVGIKKREAVQGKQSETKSTSIARRPPNRERHEHRFAAGCWLWLFFCFDNLDSHQH